MEEVRIGDTVIVIGVHCGGTATQPGIVTRVWPAKPLGLPAVNVMVLPDQGVPMTRQGLTFYPSLSAANEALAKVPFCYPHR